MNYSISGYNLYEENEFCIENVIMNEEKMNNLKKLDQMHVQDYIEIYQNAYDRYQSMN